MRGLLLDDNPDDRALAARSLRQAFPGLDLVEAGSPEDLERALKADRFDFAVTDYQLRWTDGIKVLDRLIGHDPQLPVVMFTNTGNEEVAVEAMKHGLSDYVIKRHGQYHRLAHAVRGVLDRHELRGRVEGLLAAERAAREEAERASRLKEDFLATLSHELRTPLHAVLGWTQLLKQGALDAADQKHAVEVIERNARAQARLIEDLLDLSRLESGKLKVELETADFATLAHSAIAAVQPSAEKKRIRVVEKLGSPSSPARLDPARMRQAVLNLLTNAIKFSPEGATFEVRLDEVDAHLLLEVVDQGEGIAPEFLPHVFDRFRQADSSSTRRAGGLGIGLALTKKLVEAHGGTVTARSAGLGRGSVFSLRLPKSRTRLEDRAVAGPALKAPSLDGVKALLIDDDADSLDVMRRTLEHCGSEVQVASDARTGLELLQRRPPHVVICDIGMPVEDGYRFIERVRCLSDEGMRQVPAVALTAFARAEDRERALLAGFNSHVAKPVDGYELLVVVASLAGVLERGRSCEITP